MARRLLHTAGMDEFAQECAHVSKALRRVPKETRRALSQRAKEEVAVPLARAIGQDLLSGPWGRVLSAGAKARAAADPKVVIGGKRPQVSGGAGPRALVFGREWGGSRTNAHVVPATSKHKAYRRRYSVQFANNMDPSVYPTITAQMPAVLDTYADIVIDVFDKEV